VDENVIELGLENLNPMSFLRPKGSQSQLILVEFYVTPKHLNLNPEHQL
jgi:hypothetical protein